MTVTIYHNNRCSKSRQVLQLLNERNLNPIEIYYLETPPDHTTLKKILNMLNMTPRELMRQNEQPFKDLNLDNPELTDQELIAAMINNPILIERPIVISNGKAKIGRPPENILDIL